MTRSRRAAIISFKMSVVIPVLMIVVSQFFTGDQAHLWRAFLGLLLFNVYHLIVFLLVFVAEMQSVRLFSYGIQVGVVYLYSRVYACWVYCGDPLSDNNINMFTRIGWGYLFLVGLFIAVAFGLLEKRVLKTVR